MSDLPPLIVRMPGVIEMVGLSKRTIERAVKAGAFPPPFRLALIIHESGGLVCLGPRKSPSDLRRYVSAMNASASSGGHLRGET